MSVKFDPSGKHCVSSPPDGKTPSNKLFVAMTPTKACDLSGLRHAYERIHDQFKVGSEGCVDFRQIQGGLVPACVLTYETIDQAKALSYKHHMKPAPDGKGGLFVIQFVNDPKKGAWSAQDEEDLQRRLERKKKDN